MAGGRGGDAQLLGTAGHRGGGQEVYDGATRVVQYFDKGRMELTNGSVTNGLLATEMMTGRVQTGDATFLGRPLPMITVAGDPDARNPTYADVKTKAPALFAPTPNRSGDGTKVLFTKEKGLFPANVSYVQAPPAGFFAGYDAATQHNVMDVFGDYRDQVGVNTVGLAISEPFGVSVYVGGEQTVVLMQVFERRVLTYKRTNPDPYKVEFGNIGQHYYQWRYGATGGVAVAAVVPSTPAASSAAAFPIGQVFIDASRSTNGTRYAMEIGATTGAATTNSVTILPFEHGTMLYLASRTTFFVLLEQTGSPTGSALTLLPRTFGDGGLTTALVPGPRPGTFVPRLGFGRIWQDNATVQQQLGYATGDETSFTATVQPFERGLLIFSPGANVVYELDTMMMRWYLLPLS